MSADNAPVSGFQAIYDDVMEALTKIGESHNVRMKPIDIHMIVAEIAEEFEMWQE